MEDTEVCGKVIFIGDVATGKTCLINAILTNSFFGDVMPTTTPSQSILSATDHRGVPKRIELWDTAGEEKYKSITSIYYRNTNIAVVCFDSSQPDHITSAKNWADSVLENWAYAKFIFVATKADLINEQSQQEILQKADQLFESYNPIDIIPTSSKTKMNIEGLKSILINRLEEIPIQESPKITYNEVTNNSCC